MNLFRSNKSAVGLEIGTFSVRAVELKKAIPFELSSYAEEPLGSGVMVDGEINELEDISQALRRLWKKGNFSTKNVVLGIANPKVLVRQIELPYMDKTALKSAINFQAQEYIPFPPEELILDYHVLSEVEGEDSQRMLEVLLVAANKDMVMTFCEAIDKAGLQVDVVYLSALALARALIEFDTGSVSKDDKQGSSVIVNISADISNIVVVEKGLARFARIMTLGGNDFTKTLAENLGYSLKEAEELKKKIGIIPKGQAQETLEPDEEKAASILRNVANKFIAELRRSIEYYFGEDIDSQTIERLILTGGGAEMLNFDKYISEKLKVRTEKGKPLGRVAVSKNISDEYSESMFLHEPSMGVVIGLAMRGLDNA